MKISATQTGFALYKEADVIGRCDVTPTPKGADIAALSVLSQWRRKGYGSYLLKEILRRFGGYDREAATVFTARGSPPALPGGRKFPAALRHRGSPSSTPQLSMTCPGK